MRRVINGFLELSHIRSVLMTIFENLISLSSVPIRAHFLPDNDSGECLNNLVELEAQYTVLVLIDRDLQGF